MDINQILEALNAVELFRDLTDGERAAVAGKIELERRPAGELLFEQNAPRRNLHLIGRAGSSCSSGCRRARRSGWRSSAGTISWAKAP